VFARIIQVEDPRRRFVSPREAKGAARSPSNVRLQCTGRGRAHTQRNRLGKIQQRTAGGLTRGRPAAVHSGARGRSVGGP